LPAAGELLGMDRTDSAGPSSGSGRRTPVQLQHLPPALMPVLGPLEEGQAPERTAVIADRIEVVVQGDDSPAQLPLPALVRLCLHLLPLMRRSVRVPAALPLCTPPPTTCIGVTLQGRRAGTASGLQHDGSDDDELRVQQGTSARRQRRRCVGLAHRCCHG
jgi:hypothetical protein